MASSFTSTSNSFHFTAPHSKPNPKTQYCRPRLVVLAKAGNNGNPFASFRLRKSSEEDNPSSSNGDTQSGNPNPFFFNLSKLSDIRSLIPVVNNAAGIGVNPRQKDTGTVFVAGAEGILGIRIAQALLRRGFKVRAGVSDLDSAQELARFAAKYKIISTEESKRLNAVESTFETAESIAKSIGNASKVVVTIGQSENGSATSEVSTSDAIQVVEAAQLAGVSHVTIIYDESALNTSTYNVLDGITSFFNNLFAKSQPLTVEEFLQRVVETDLRYTFIKTKLTDEFGDEKGYGVVVRTEGSGSPDDYKVSKSVMASLVADLFSNTAVAENKVVEVCTDPSAPSKPIYELFSAIPEDGRRQAYTEAQAKAKAQEEAITASEKAREAAEAAKKLSEEVKKLSEQETKAASLAKEAEEKAEVAGIDVDSLLNKAKDFGSGLSWGKLGSQLATAVQGGDGSIGIPKVQVATVRGQTKARSLPAQQARVKSVNPFVARGSSSASVEKKEQKSPQGKESAKKEMRSVLGGLFKQETIYVDDD